MVLIEFLLFVAIVVLIALLAINAMQKHEASKKKEKYVPPRGPVGAQGGPELHIHTTDREVLWFEMGNPTKIGTQVEVNMKSGRVGIYELRNAEQPAIGMDWSWYDFEFVRYKDIPESPKDGPVTPSE